MEENILMNIYDEHLKNPILFIPRVKSYFNEYKIRTIFEKLNMGVIERIDIRTNNNPNPNCKEKINRVFIHYKYWNDSENSKITRERLSEGKDIKIIYDDPWFWKISAFRKK